MNNATGHGGSASHAVPDYWWYQARSELLETALARYATGAQVALDLGSADAPSASWLREAIPRVASLDIDPRGLGSNGVCGSGLALPFANGSFDLVSAFDVIEHLAPEAVALDEIYRVLRPDGILLASVPAYQWAWTDFDVANGHHRRYTKNRAVGALQRAGFVVERATYGFTTVFPLFVAERFARRIRRQQHTSAAATVSVPAVPPLVNSMLLRLSRLDARLMAKADLPFGSSIFVAARRRT